MSGMRRRANRGLSLRDGVLAVAGAMRPRATPHPQQGHTQTRRTPSRHHARTARCTARHATARSHSFIHSFIHPYVTLEHAQNVHAQCDTNLHTHGYAAVSFRTCVVHALSLFLGTSGAFVVCPSRYAADYTGQRVHLLSLSSWSA